MSEVNLKEIGKRIYERRRQLGYTQEELAELMNVSIQMISNLERGNKSIRIENLLKICSILNVSTDYILTGKQNELDIKELSDQLQKLSPRDNRMIRQIIDYCINN